MIVAVDFDGVLCEDEFPEIGAEVPAMVGAVRRVRAAGHEVVLWTSRTGERLEEALRWCRGRGLEFDAVNEQAPSNREAFEAAYPQGTRKVYADVYVDDHSLEWVVQQLRYGRAGAVALALARIEEVFHD